MLLGLHRAPVLPQNFPFGLESQSIRCNIIIHRQVLLAATELLKHIHPSVESFGIDGITSGGKGFVPAQQPAFVIGQHPENHANPRVVCTGGHLLIKALSTLIDLLGKT
jgi:hypothetical protein